ncbi:unnamed protein product [Heligmosomoides polygyrus]|uniref:WWE domain-containing protein n=1 Tax=Heligmosomoides polygyrus TaxID=6339 RepID=A0A3P7YNN2_HELPZ|nr:unnamed protein product [Heligmosomoides polygyrus]
MDERSGFDIRAVSRPKTEPGPMEDASCEKERRAEDRAAPEKRAEAEEKLPADGDLHPRKEMLSVFWGVRGVVYWKLIPSGATTNSQVYCNQLQELGHTLQIKRPQLDKTYFLHDNAKPRIQKPSRATAIRVGAIQATRVETAFIAQGNSSAGFRLRKGPQGAIQNARVESAFVAQGNSAAGFCALRAAKRVRLKQYAKEAQRRVDVKTSQISDTQLKCKNAATHGNRTSGIPRMKETL